MATHDKARQLKCSCLVICYCDVGLAPISLATLYVLRTLLTSLVTCTFLKLKEMTGKVTKYFALSTSSRILITSAGVLSLSIVIWASRLSPPAVAMARLGNDVHMLHVKIYLKYKVHMSHIRRSIACDELDEHVYEWYMRSVYGICVAYMVYAYTIRFFQRSYTPLYAILPYTLYIYAYMRICIYTHIYTGQPYICGTEHKQKYEVRKRYTWQGRSQRQADTQKTKSNRSSTCTFCHRDSA